MKKRVVILIALVSGAINACELANPSRGLEINSPVSNTMCSYGFSSTCGRRLSMEDAHDIQKLGLPKDGAFFAIYDGHGGQSVAQCLNKWLCKQVTNGLTDLQDTKPETIGVLLRKAYQDVDNQILHEIDQGKIEDSGSTAVTALMLENYCHLAWCGDSRALVIRGGKVIQATKDHKPNAPAEKERLEAHDGLVIGDRLVGDGLNISVSRSYGDPTFKKSTKNGFIVEPEIISLELKPRDLIVLACDGLWDRVSNDDVAIAYDTLSSLDSNSLSIKNFFPDDQPSLTGMNPFLRIVAQSLTRLAYNRSSSDNISALVVEYQGEVKQ